MPAPTPQYYQGKRILQHPYGENQTPIPPLFGAITDPGTGLIVGYLPIKALDNGDGTATIKVDTEITVNDPTINIGNIKVGSSDNQTSGNRWLRVEGDGTVHVIVDSLPIQTTDVAMWGGTPVTGADITPNILNLDVLLSTRASEATLLALAASVASIDTDIDTPLSSRASEATLAAFLAAFNLEDFATQTTLLTRLADATFTSRINTLGQKTMATSTPVVLPSDQSPIDVNIISTPGGEAADAGQLFAGANPTINLTSAGSEQAYMLIRNPAASGKVVKIKRFVLSAMTLNKAVAYFIYFAPTVTANGTAVSGFSTTAGVATVPVALITTLPTVTAFGNRIISSSASNGSTVILDEEFAIRIPANTSLLITVIPQTTNTDTTIAVLWAEV
jgi:hypothetical protein